jgi:hypothetical protein
MWSSFNEAPKLFAAALLEISIRSFWIAPEFFLTTRGIRGDTKRGAAIARASKNMHAVKHTPMPKQRCFIHVNINTRKAAL